IRDFQHWHFVSSEGRAIKAKIKPSLKASNGEFLRDAAVAGRGIVYIPSFLVYREIERGELVPLLKEYVRPEIEAYAIYPQTRHLSQRVRAFVNFLAERFSGVPYWDKNIG
ncbi:MAG: LysR substrate-binding domain-containing protein, partial [Gammaproteobacteria bacterium]|nr:LysR substrate-binding domain-containing protein [Gammaproteobacteria bacterium]